METTEAERLDVNTILLRVHEHFNWFTGVGTVALSARVWVHRGRYYPGQLRSKKFGAACEIKKDDELTEDQIWVHLRASVEKLIQRRRWQKRRCDWGAAETQFRASFKALKRLVEGK